MTKKLISLLKTFFYSDSILNKEDANKSLNKENNQVKKIFLTFEREKISQTSIQKRNQYLLFSQELLNLGFLRKTNQKWFKEVDNEDLSIIEEKLDLITPNNYEIILFYNEDDFLKKYKKPIKINKKSSINICFCRFYCKEKENIYLIKELPEKGFFCLVCKNIISLSASQSVKVLILMEENKSGMKFLKFDSKRFESSQLSDLNFVKEASLNQFIDSLKNLEIKNVDNKFFFFKFSKYKNGEYFLRIISHDNAVIRFIKNNWKLGKADNNKVKGKIHYRYFWKN